MIQCHDIIEIFEIEIGVIKIYTYKNLLKDQLKDLKWLCTAIH